VEEQSDQELVELARAGDKAAFGELYTRYQSLAHGLARRLAGRDDIARELVQDAMLQAYLSLNQLRDPARFKGWLCGIVLNVGRSFRRDQKTLFFSLESLTGGQQPDSSAASESEFSPEQIAEEQELHQMTLAAVNSLSTRDREITLAFYYDQLSAQEIAVLLKISTGAVKVRLHRARQRLREKMLSQYPDLLDTRKRRNEMTKVKIAGVVKSEPKDETGQKLNLYTVILVDEAGKRALPIWVGPAEGQSIAWELGNGTTPRPLTYTFMANLLKAVGASLEEVTIATLIENTYYATVKIRNGGKLLEVDARPSDAIAMALLVDCPVTVAEEVLTRAAVKLPEQTVAACKNSAKVSPGTARILEELVSLRSQSQKGPPISLLSDEIQKANQALIARLYQP
jgi:RNA polymerase sigma factor (sigma-70 family)